MREVPVERWEEWESKGPDIMHDIPAPPSSSWWVRLYRRWKWRNWESSLTGCPACGSWEATVALLGIDYRTDQANSTITCGPCGSVWSVAEAA